MRSLGPFLAFFGTVVAHLGDSNGHGHEHLHLRQDSPGLVSRATNITHSGVGNHSHAGDDILEAALLVLGKLNRLQLQNPRFNKNEFADGHVLDPAGMKATPPSILDFTTVINSNSTNIRRALNGSTPLDVEQGPNTRITYSIPPELAEAARKAAENTPQTTSRGNHSTVARDIRKRYSLNTNDTNSMSQALVYADGLSGGYHFGESAKGESAWEYQKQVAFDAAGINSSDFSKLLGSSSSNYWMANIPQRGIHPLAPKSYKVWRNVKDYGAKGDGKADDIDAINRAISDGGRCGADCGSSTVLPAVVFFPPGTYLVSTSIVQYYNTQLLGDPLNVPTILAASSFIGLGVITSDVYTGPGPNDQWYVNQNNFLRSVRNFKMDITQTQQDAEVCAIHWQVAQGTSLENIEFHMSMDEKTTQQGIYMENGSGGFLGDLTFVGGKFGAYFGNQQFTSTHLVFVHCQTALQIHWDWAWTMQDVVIESCGTGIIIVGGAGGPFSTGQAVGSLILADALIANTATGIVTTLYKENSTSLLLQNVGFYNVKTAVFEDSMRRNLVDGGREVKLKSWGFGKLNDPAGTRFVNGQDIPAMPRPQMLVGGVKNYGPEPNLFARRRPKYHDLGQTQLFEVKDYGAKGDGVSDDTAVLNSVFSMAANMSSIVFIPHGIYIVRDTLKIPVNSRIIGQVWSQIMGTGVKFQDARHPHPVVRVGEPGDVGVLEIQDLLFTVSGPTAGAVLVEWNVHEQTQGSAGIWDSHIRVGGAKGSGLQKNDCPKLTGRVNPNCVAASLLFHLTEKSSVYMENIWMWTADHDLDVKSQDQIDVYSARGVLIESQGPSWLYGTASEHNVLYQYQFSGAENIIMTMIQTESPYYQDVPTAPKPFEIGQFSNDPNFAECSPDDELCAKSWAVRIIDSTKIHILGAGLYSWFSRYSQDCLKTEDCQARAVQIEQSADVWLYNICTKAIKEMISPTGAVPTLAKDNRNGFLSSILAWVRNPDETVGKRRFSGFAIYNGTIDEELLSSVPKICQTALTEIIKCHAFTNNFLELQYRSSLDDLELTDKVCDKSCGTSLKSWFDTVTFACKGYDLGLSVPNRLGGIVWAGWNETCLRDPSTGKYCNEVMRGYSLDHSIERNPKEELCSWCSINKRALMQKSSYSSYDKDWKQDLEYTYKTCSVTGNTEVPPAVVKTPKEPPVLCASGRTYTTAAGDTCDSIALANNVSSASLYMGNSPLHNCNEIPNGLQLCLPFECGNTIQYGPDDTCGGLEATYGMSFGRIRQLNAWLELGCRNMQVAAAVFGRTLCLGAEGGRFTATAPIPGPTLLPGVSDGYTGVAVPPPEHASKIAEGTTRNCGLWVIASEDSTCVRICAQNKITSALFLAANPSLSSDDCSRKLVPRQAYCVGPVYGWDSNGSGSTSPSTDVFDNFDDHDMAGWKVADGNFDASSGELVVAQTDSGKAVYDAEFENFILEADVAIINNGGNGGLIFRSSNIRNGPDSYKGYFAGITSDSWLILGRADDGWTQLQAQPLNVAIGQKYNVRVQATGDLIKVYVDDMNTPKITQRDGSFKKGYAGVRVWHTGMRMDNFKIQKVDVFNDFNDNSVAEWKAIDGRIDASSGELVVSRADSAKAIYNAAAEFNNFALEADIAMTTGGGNGGLIFRASALGIGADSYRGYFTGITSNGWVILGRADNSWNQLQAQKLDIAIDHMYHIKIQATGDLIQVFVDDMSTPKISQHDGTFAKGSTGVRVWHTGLRVDNFRVTSM